MVTLKGMTWSHSRGYSPLVEASRRYKALHPDVDIVWEQRSLQAFADVPLDLLGKTYDLLVIDHPHIGEVERAGSLLPMSGIGRDAQLAELAARSVGASHRSYNRNGTQWALAIDAAAQVACYRADLLQTLPRCWDDVVALAEKGKVLFPLKPVDSMCSLLSMLANTGNAIGKTMERMADPAAIVKALHLLDAVARHVPEVCLSQNPFEVLETMSTSSDYAYCPLLFGYTNYSRAGYRPHLVTFTDIAGVGTNGAVGAVLGGTGISISSQTAHADIAYDFSFWLASGAVQSGFYCEFDGQPAHASAWDSAENNALCHDFFKNTRATLENAWVRPRYDGFLRLMDQGGDLVNAYLRGKATPEATATGLEEVYQSSLSFNPNVRKTGDIS